MEEFKLGEHRTDVERLLTYIPWLESKVGASVSSYYEGNDIKSNSFSFPVYETMLLNFVNEASKTSLMDSNYIYAYSGRNLKTPEDEKAAIENAGLTDGNLLVGILSRYVLGGMTKGKLWTVAVEEGIFLAVLKKMKKLLEIWDQPLA